MIPEYTPLVSIIMPIRNEEDFIAQTLDAVLTQKYPSKKIEVLIADGMSTDQTRPIINELAEKHPQIMVRVIDNNGFIVSTGMNLAIQQAKGDVIIRVDGHTTIASDYVRQCVDSLIKSRADNVGGRMCADSTSWFGKSVALATSTRFGVGGSRFHYSDMEGWVDTVYMGAWPRKVFYKIGLFDEDLVRDQDDEFNYRIRAAGGKILLSPDIQSQYNVRSSLSALYRQYYQYGYWKVRVLQKHPRQMSLHQFVPLAFVMALLISLFFGFLPIIRPLSLLTPALYALANLLASVNTAAKRGWQYLPVLPITFAVLHLSYGFGFLVGLFKFWNRWGDKIGNVPVLLEEQILS